MSQRISRISPQSGTALQPPPLLHIGSLGLYPRYALLSRSHRWHQCYRCQVLSPIATIGYSRDDLIRFQNKTPAYLPSTHPPLLSDTCNNLNTPLAGYAPCQIRSLQSKASLSTEIHYLINQCSHILKYLCIRHFSYHIPFIQPKLCQQWIKHYFCIVLKQ